MADAYQTTTSLDFSTKAYNARAAFGLRPRLMFDQLADVFATEQTHTGISVQFAIFGDLPVASTPLVENEDVALVAASDSTVVATLNEYGSAMASTAALEGTSYIPIDPALANLIGYSAGLSIDEVARNTAVSGTNVFYTAAGGHTTKGTTLDTDIVTANDVRIARSYLVRNNAMPWDTSPSGGAGGDGSGDTPDINSLGNGTGGSGWFAAITHPDVLYDLRSQTGSGTWRLPSEYAAGFGGQPGHQGVWSGEFGGFEGFRFIENSRAPELVNAGSASANLFQTLFFGKEGILKIWSIRKANNGPRPQIVVGPVVDRLRRFNPIGWYWFGAYGIYRQQCLYQLISGGTLAGTTTGGDDPAINL